MNIAIIAHDYKKELMTQFCIAYCGILSHHSICATGTTGKMIEDATGLNVVKYLGGKQGGAEQIGALISCNQIDLLLMFRDPLNPKPMDANALDLLRLCDVHNIPAATNIAEKVQGPTQTAISLFRVCAAILFRKCPREKNVSSHD